MDRKPKISVRDGIGYLFLGISVIMLCKSLMLCFSSDIWYDELFTVGMIKHSYGDLIAFTARDVHPPLYYCIVKFLVDLCKLISTQTNPVVIAKMVSVLPYFILFLYSVTFIRRRFGIFTGGLFLFCTISMPQLSAYTVEVRMYSWALLFVTAAFLHAYGIVTCCDVREKIEQNAEQNIGQNVGQNISQNVGQSAGQSSRERLRRLHAAALVCYGLAAAYTQYFACVAVIMVYLYVLVVFLRKDRGRIREWLVCVAVSIVGYIPWLYALFGQITAVNENYWILPLTWRSLGGCVKFLMKPAFTNEVLNIILAVVLFAAYVLVFVYEFIKLYHNGIQNHKNSQNSAQRIRRSILRNEKQSINLNAEATVENEAGTYEKYKTRFLFAAAGIGVLAGLVLFGFAASFGVRPIFVYRYMIPALGCFWLGFAVNLDHMLGTIMLCKSTTGIPERKKAKNKVVKIFLVAVIFGIAIIGLRNYRAFMGEEEYKILLMKETEKALSSIAPDDIVIYNFDQVQAVTSYYIDPDAQSYLWCGTPEALIQDIIRPYHVVEEVQMIKEWCEKGRNVWFVGSFNSRDDIVKEWSEQGMEIEETGSYLLERYWFNLYKVSVGRQ
ncbi:MAG: hypothetical protein NC416_09795 [Eubacterium sp.]|nr:hypothetical protein [Eubacterium sp.]